MTAATVLIREVPFHVATASRAVALERPDRIAAIAPVAGAMALDPALVRIPVPVLHVHGTADRHAPFEGGVGPASLEGGVRRSVPETLAAWVRAHGAEPVPAVTRLPDLVDDGTRVERHAFAAPGDPEAVVLVLVVGGGHTWPGAAPRLAALGPSTLDVDVNELMWAYFAPRPLPRPRSMPRAAARAMPSGDGARRPDPAQSQSRRMR